MVVQICGQRNVLDDLAEVKVKAARVPRTTGKKCLIGSLPYGFDWANLVSPDK
jgi:hypothetical protein